MKRETISLSAPQKRSTTPPNLNREQIETRYFDTHASTALIKNVLAARPSDDVWVFGDSSLIWNETLQTKTNLQGCVTDE
ncbi:hypothetical protein TDB9533_00751 [Thalassocella blandensis]|nr:hypothetical protein TDB9533_00751 [Thalassocella blandensis]